MIELAFRPVQYTWLPIGLTAGAPPTVTVTLAVLVQPAVVPVTVYVVVVAGEAVTLGPVVGDSPVVGLQL